MIKREFYDEEGEIKIDGEFMIDRNPWVIPPESVMQQGRWDAVQSYYVENGPAIVNTKSATKK